MKNLNEPTLEKYEATLLRIECGKLVFDDGSCVDEKTLNRNKILKEELRTSDNMARVGARFGLVRNAQGSVYLDLGSCYEIKKRKRIFEDEKEFRELKKSALYACVPDDLTEPHPKQFQVLTSVMASFANSRIKGWLEIGYDDNGFRTGINHEIPSLKDQAEYEVNLKNYIAQVLCSRTFAMTLDFTWTTHEDGLKTLTISVPLWNGDLLLLNGNALYVRDGASSVQMKHGDLLNYVRHYNSILNQAI